LICNRLELLERACQNSPAIFRGKFHADRLCRVSTDEQNLAMQLDALRAAGCEVVFQDAASGARSDRKGLVDALDRCAAGDVLVVWKLDRLGRSLSALVGIVEALQGRDAGLKVLTGAGASIDTTKPEGRFILGVFASLAEFERELIRERTKAGMVAAKRRGRHVGRPRKLTPHKIDHARQLIAEGKETQAGAAALLGVGFSTLRRALNGPDDVGGSPARAKRPVSVRAGKRV
jgi:DNA invertase Pin-like site-specific DNA recombinase